LFEGGGVMGWILRVGVLGIAILGTGLQGTAVAQGVPSNIMADDSLGGERSQVIENFTDNPTEAIRGGAIRGPNLFHSFSQFNVSEGRSAYFFVENPGIQNILTRVTGNNPSNILGRLGTFQISTTGQFAPTPANLFLINPNGVVFGANSNLDLGGSFIVTTANALQFPNGELFSASVPTVPSKILTVNPSALLYSAIVAQNLGIINRTRSENTNVLVGETTGLQVQDGHSLILAGGDVRLENGYALAFGGGRIELGGLSDVGIIGLESIGNGFGMTFPQNVPRGNLILQSGAVASYSGGATAVYAKNVMMTDNSLLSTGLLAGEGSDGKPSGDVSISATGQIMLDRSYISSNALPRSLAGSGSIQIQTGSLQINNRSGIVLTSDQPQGNLIINAKEEISVDNGFITAGSSSGIGANGDVVINARNINITNQGLVGSASMREGRSGNITLQAKNEINLTRGGKISGGSNAKLFGKTNTEASGAIKIRARSLTLTDPETLIAASNFDAARAGNIQIVTDESVVLKNAAAISASTAGSGNGGDIQIQTRLLVLDQGGLINTATNQQGKSGNIQINAVDSIVISRFAIKTNAITGELFFAPSGILASTFAAGDAGSIAIDTQRLTLSEGGYIQASTGLTRNLLDRNSPAFQGYGEGGQVSIQATESLDVSGAIQLQTSNIGTDTNGNGNAGALTITTGRFSLRDGASISSAARNDSTGNGGDFILKATTFAEIVGTTLTPQGELPTSLSTRTDGSGNAGNLIITTPKLSIRDGAQVETGNRIGSSGQAGNINVNAPDAIEVVGTTKDLQSVSKISSETTNTTNAGRLTLQTGQLSLREGGIISTSTSGDGRGGDLSITANTVEILGSPVNGLSGMTTSTVNAGASGDLTLNVQRLWVREGGVISAGTTLGSTGQGGNLILNATDALEVIGSLEQGPSRLSASSNGTGPAGNIRLTTPRLTLANQGRVITESSTINGGNIDLTISDLLLLRREAQISATAGAKNPQALGAGGNININSRFIVAIPKENSDIMANATQGRGGNVNLTSQGIFGLQFRPQLTPFSDITASSDFGLTGTVNLNTPDNTGIQNGLTQLPTNAIDTNALLAQTCIVRKDKTEGSFYIVGTGGIPNRPNDPALSEYPTTITAKSWKLGDPIAESQGFYKLTDGRLIMGRECDR
jgi:filamentous hemagglutinin family protein